MSDPTLEQKITAVLRKHFRYGNREPELCGCGVWKPWAVGDYEDSRETAEEWEPHVADVLAAVVRDESAETKAANDWNEWACKKNQELFRQAEAERDEARAALAEETQRSLEWMKAAGERRLQLAALRDAQAEAWDEGWRVCAGVEGTTEQPTHPNPYRAALDDNPYRTTEGETP